MHTDCNVPTIAFTFIYSTVESLLDLTVLGAAISRVHVAIIAGGVDDYAVSASLNTLLVNVDFKG